MIERGNTSHRLNELSLLLLLLLTLFVYAPVGSYDFVSYDDQGYVTGNRQVRAGLTCEGISWALHDASVGHWHPLTWLSHMADVQIYGLNPGGHHLTNLLFHLLNTCLLFFVLRQMTGMFRPSLLVAALFALHPLNVESVAWIAERKNVLSTFFWLAALGAYGYYVRRPGCLRYAALFVLFALGLAAKPMLVTLPFVLLLLDYWPLKRWPEKNPLPEEQDIGSSFSPGKKRSVFFLFREKIPLLLLTGISIIFTLWSARAGGALAVKDALPFTTRLANALVAYGTYPVKMLWPFNLSVVYPYPEAIPPGKVFAAAVFLSVMTALVVFKAKRLPYLVTGWFWYLGTLLPVIGLIQVGSQSMADRYAYVPLMGIFIVMAWGIADFPGKWFKDRAVLTVLLVLILTALTVRTWFQIPYWQNSSTLFSHAVEETRGNYIAHYHLGTSLLGEGKINEAIGHFQKAAQIKPNYEPAYNNIGVALQLEGRFSEALASYRMAIAIKPDYGDALYNMGTLFDAMGNLDEAIIAYRQARQWSPESAPIYNNLGVALTKKGNTEEAIVAYRQALLLNPDYAGAHYNLALTLRKKGLAAEAAAHLREAARINSFSR